MATRQHFDSHNTMSSALVLCVDSDPGREHVLNVYDYETCAKVQEVPLVHPYDLKLSPEADELSVGDRAGGVVILNADTYETVVRLQLGDMTATAFSPDGALFACGGVVREIYLLTRPDYTTIQERRDQHTYFIETLAFTPNSLFLASGSADNTAIIWSVPQMEVIHHLRGHTNYVWPTVFLSDALLATAGVDKAIRVWSVATGECVHVLQWHTRSIRGLALSPDGTKLAAGGEDRIVTIWETATFTCIHTTALFASDVNRVLWVDEDAIVVSVYASHLLLYSLTQASVVRTYGKQKGYVNGIVLLHMPSK